SARPTTATLTTSTTTAAPAEQPTAAPTTALGGTIRIGRTGRAGLPQRPGRLLAQLAPQPYGHGRHGHAGDDRAHSDLRAADRAHQPLQAGAGADRHDLRPAEREKSARHRRRREGYLERLYLRRARLAFRRLCGRADDAGDRQRDRPDRRLLRR